MSHQLPLTSGECGFHSYSQTSHGGAVDSGSWACLSHDGRILLYNNSSHAVQFTTLWQTSWLNCTMHVVHFRGVHYSHLQVVLYGRLYWHLLHISG